MLSITLQNKSIAKSVINTTLIQVNIINNMETTLNQRIKIFAALKGVAQKELAEVLEVSPNSISSIINGHTNPRMKTLGKLFNAYPDLNRSWLMTGEGEMIKAPGSRQRSEQGTRYASATDFEMLTNEVQMLKQMILKMMGKIENFLTNPSKVAKKIALHKRGSLSRDHSQAA